MTGRLPAGTKGDSRGGIACSRQQCRAPGGGSQRPDSYAGSAAPSITGVCGQPPPIFTHQGVAAATSTTPMRCQGLRRHSGCFFLEWRRNRFWWGLLECGQDRDEPLRVWRESSYEQPMRAFVKWCHSGAGRGWLARWAACRRRAGVLAVAGGGGAGVPWPGPPALPSFQTGLASRQPSSELAEGAGLLTLINRFHPRSMRACPWPWAHAHGGHAAAFTSWPGRRRPAAMPASQGMRRVMIAWIWRSSAAAIAARAC